MNILWQTEQKIDREGNRNWGGQSTWIGRNLENYLHIHRKRIKDKGVNVRECTTLTRARALIFGIKVKRPTHDPTMLNQEMS